MAKVQKDSLLVKIKNVLIWPIRRFINLSRRGKIIVIILIVLIAYWRINAARNAGLKVTIQQASYGKIVESVNASGEVAAQNSANLAFQTAGEVKEVNFNEGDRVKKGDVIAKLDTIYLYNSYKTAEASLRAAQASLDSTYDQIQGHENDETFAQIDTRTTAETAKDKAYLAYVTASKNLSGAYIKAPFDGILTKVPENVSPGAYISLPTTSNFQVVDPETTYFDAEVSEVDIHKLTSGAKAEIDIDAYPDTTFEGAVTGFNFTSTTTSTGGTAYTVRVTLPDNDSLKFKVGMNGDVDILISEKDNVLLVPITAIVEEGSSTYVWKVEGGKAKKTKVSTGISSVNDIEIISGLKDGDEIITRPSSGIKVGSRVKNS